MDKTKLLPIGVFSKLSGANIKSLRYYDQIGVLPPAFVDPDTGYRYYAFSQIHVVDAIQRRHIVYNENMKDVFALEREGRVLLFAPSSTRGFHRTERDVEKIRALWQDGWEQGMARLDEVERFLAGE